MGECAIAVWCDIIRYTLFNNNTPQSEQRWNVLIRQLLHTFNDNTPHSERRWTVLIRQTVHAQTRASSLLKLRYMYQLYIVIPYNQGFQNEKKYDKQINK